MFGNSWGNSYAKFVIVDIKFHFTCRELHLHGNTRNDKNIIPPIVDLAINYTEKKEINDAAETYTSKHVKTVDLASVKRVLDLF